MKVSLVRIGNSQGIRIPKTLIDQCGFGNEIELEVRGDALVLRSARPSRQGWDEAFARLTKSGKKDEPLLPDYMSEEWDEAEWTW
jgi:antitoxin MazE